MHSFSSDDIHSIRWLCTSLAMRSGPRSGHASRTGTNNRRGRETASLEMRGDPERGRMTPTPHHLSQQSEFEFAVRSIKQLHALIDGVIDRPLFKFSLPLSLDRLNLRNAAWPIFRVRH
mmetsp:Transcript_42928/g.84656  ORF Transcript_42928/g.84656 Transcript_42928/m.84656 type:complete len:119 (-) Transcript_42928:331-687(-)